MPKYKPSTWTDGELDYLNLNYKTQSDKQIADKIHKTVGQVADTRRKLNLVRSKSGPKVKNPIVKTKITHDELCSINDLCKKYPAEADYLKRLHYIEKQVLTKEEIKYFVAKYDHYRSGLEVVEPSDVSILEQLLICEITNLRILRQQKDLNEAANMADLEGDIPKGLRYRQDSLELNRQTKDHTFQVEKYLKMLNVTREQRMKNRNESKISFGNVIKQLEDLEVRAKLSKYGDLLQSSTIKKQQSMIQDELINVAPKDSGKKEDRQEATTEFQEV